MKGKTKMDQVFDDVTIQAISCAQHCQSRSLNFSQLELLDEDSLLLEVGCSMAIG